jgi:hypothetical protein
MPDPPREFHQTEASVPGYVNAARNLCCVNSDLQVLRAAGLLPEQFVLPVCHDAALLRVQSTFGLSSGSASASASSSSASSSSLVPGSPVLEEGSLPARLEMGLSWNCLKCRAAVALGVGLHPKLNELPRTHLRQLSDLLYVCLPAFDDDSVGNIRGAKAKEFVVGQQNDAEEILTAVIHTFQLNYLFGRRAEALVRCKKCGYTRGTEEQLPRGDLAHSIMLEPDTTQVGVKYETDPTNPKITTVKLTQLLGKHHLPEQLGPKDLVECDSSQCKKTLQQVSVGESCPGLWGGVFRGARTSPRRQQIHVRLAAGPLPNAAGSYR